MAAGGTPAARCLSLLLLPRRASGRRVGGRELGADEHQRRLGVARLGNRREGELGDRARAKDEAVSRAAVLEGTEFLTLPNVVTGPHLRVDDARGDLHHADRHEGHQPDDGIVSLDEDDRPGRDVREVGLRVGGLDRVPALRIGLRVVVPSRTNARTTVPATGLCHRW